MVRSLENFPELATFKMALRAQASGAASINPHNATVNLFIGASSTD